MDIFYLIMQLMFLSAIPLLIVALGGMFSERSGVVNIALEGIMLFGAFFGVLSINLMQHYLPASLYNSFTFEQIVLIVGVLVGGLFGLLFSLLHAFASINMKADQVISGTALNMFAAPFGIFLARSLTITSHRQQIPFNSSNFLMRKIPILGDIPFIGDILFKQVYITTVLGFIILIVAYLVVFKTKFGLRLRSCGEHPQAADSAGINVQRMRYIGVMISGALSGMGGVILIVTTDIQFNATVSGYGFLALAVLIFGQWKPFRIFGAALFFGLMTAIASNYSNIHLLSALNLPGNFYKMVPFIMTLVLLSFTSVHSQGPKAAGEVYDAGKR